MQVLHREVIWSHLFLGLYSPENLVESDCWRNWWWGKLFGAVVFSNCGTGHRVEGPGSRVLEMVLLGILGRVNEVDESKDGTSFLKAII